MSRRCCEWHGWTRADRRASTSRASRWNSATDGYAAYLRLADAGTPAGSNGFEYPLPVPGEAVIPELGVCVSAAPAAASTLRDPRGDAVAVRAASVDPPFVVRTWRPGDCFRPLGLGGRTKKLQDFFVDRKVRREERAAIPLVIDARVGVVWVAGHGLAEDVRITAPEEGVLVLKVTKLGGVR